MSAANPVHKFESRILRCFLISTVLFIASAPPVLAVEKSVDPNAKQNKTVKRLPNQIQPTSAAAGALRILLVDDDLSDNNHHSGDSRLSPSDGVFRKLVADAVGGDAKAWSIETVKPYASGPGIERLRPFSLIVWYTGASYGGNPDNTAVLSIQDEKTVRRYLEEVGGAVILVSPGYLGKVLAAGSTGDKANWPFLTEVMGVRGGIGLAQRFEPGTVQAPGSASFRVGKGSSTVETQFSMIDPEGAVAVFTTTLVAAKNSAAPAPVATANAHGRGRIVYVGFTFENLAEADLAPAFKALLAAAGPQGSPAIGATTQEPMKQQTAASDPGPLTVQISGTPASTTVSWSFPTAPIVNASILGPGQTTTKAAAPVPRPTVNVGRRDANGGNLIWPWRLVADASQGVDFTAVPGKTYIYGFSWVVGGVKEFKDVYYTVPQAKDPESLSIIKQSDGSVILSWPEVPGVTKYRVHTSIKRRIRWDPVDIVSGATEWRSPPNYGAPRFWAVNSLYERNGAYVSLSGEDSWAVVEGE